MRNTTIDGTLDYIARILKRELTGEEILSVGIAFQFGILRGLEEAEKNK